MDGLHDVVKCRRRRLAGHILRLSRNRIAHAAMELVPEGSSRNRGRPNKTWRKWKSTGIMQTQIGKDRCRWLMFIALCSELSLYKKTFVRIYIVLVS